MNTPPRFPFDHHADALDALTNGTFWPRTARYAEHMRMWLAQERPPLGVRRPVTTEQDEAA